MGPGAAAAPEDPFKVTGKPASDAREASPPPAAEAKGKGHDNILNQLPDLLAPLMASGIALEILVEAVGAEERRTSVKSASESIKAHAEDQKVQNDKALSELKTQIEKLAKENALSPLKKAFKIIGMVLGAIASVATIALGVMTGNPLLIGAGVLMAALTVDSIMAEATDGKYCLNALVTNIAEKCGADEKTAKWIALGFTVLLTVASIALSFGAAGAAKGIEVATKAADIIVKIQTAAALASGVNSVATGTLAIVSAVNQFDIAESKANYQKIQAMLERIKEAIGVEEDFLKFLVENANAVIAQAAEIVEQAAEAQTQILSGGSPAMA
jgi:hypothetical protein